MEDVKERLFQLAEKFMDFYRKEEYRKAKHCYDTAFTVAMFLGLNDDEKIKLFGDADTGKIGLFDSNIVQRVFYHTSVKGKMDKSTEKYEDFELNQIQRKCCGIYPKK